MIVCNACGSIYKTMGGVLNCPCTRLPTYRPSTDLFDREERDEHGWREVDWQEALNPDEGDKG